MRDVGHLSNIEEFWEGVQELGGCEGRPMVWETREVREENCVGTPVVYLRPDASLLANTLRGDDDTPGPRSMSTRRNVFPYNAAATTTVDATGAIDSDSRNSFRGFTLLQPPSNEPSHV